MRPIKITDVNLNRNFVILIKCSKQFYHISSNEICSQRKQLDYNKKLDLRQIRL